MVNSVARPLQQTNRLVLWVVIILMVSRLAGAVNSVVGATGNQTGCGQVSVLFIMIAFFAGFNAHRQVILWRRQGAGGVSSVRTGPVPRQVEIQYQPVVNWPRGDQVTPAGVGGVLPGEVGETEEQFIPLCLAQQRAIDAAHLKAGTPWDADPHFTTNGGVNDRLSGRVKKDEFC